jgi:hypothetical protein
MARRAGVELALEVVEIAVGVARRRMDSGKAATLISKSATARMPATRSAANS